MADIATSADSEIRLAIETMLEFIVYLGMQDRCSLEEFKNLLVGAIQASRSAGGTHRPSAAIHQRRVAEDCLSINLG